MARAKSCSIVVRSLRDLVITFRESTPFAESSLLVNSANMGPYGDAIVHEIIPALEQQFNLVAEPWARLLGGWRSGGWGALSLQIFYPDHFGGVWAISPDPVDFNHFQLVNIYSDDNAHHMPWGWATVPRPASRYVDGNPMFMVTNWDWHSLARDGPEGISLGWQAFLTWNAAFSPVGEDGYPRPLWDRRTGVIDKDVAEYWRENYDLNYILQRDWDELGPKLVGKLHLWGADMDLLYANGAQYAMGDFLETTTDPYYEGYSRTVPRLDEGGDLSAVEMLEEMKEHMLRYGPDDGADILGLNP